MNHGKLAGLLFFLAGSVVLMGIITAEALYPALYTTAQSEISDLGSTKPPEIVILQPSATIFNLTMLVSGLLILTGTYCQHRCYRRFTASIPLGLFGLGLVGLGIFPGNISPMPTI
jgi:hypothetical membrane protein